MPKCQKSPEIQHFFGGQSFIRDINTTVSTWLDTSILMSEPPFVRGNKSAARRDGVPAYLQTSDYFFVPRITIVTETDVSHCLIPDRYNLNRSSYLGKYHDAVISTASFFMRIFLTSEVRQIFKEISILQSNLFPHKGSVSAIIFFLKMLFYNLLHQRRIYYVLFKINPVLDIHHNTSEKLRYIYSYYYFAPPHRLQCRRNSFWHPNHSHNPLLSKSLTQPSDQSD